MCSFSQVMLDDLNAQESSGAIAYTLMQLTSTPDSSHLLGPWGDWPHNLINIRKAKEGLPSVQRRRAECR